MTVRNFIDTSERIFKESTVFAAYSDLWRSDGVTIEPSTTVYQDADFGSLKAYGSANGSIFFNDWETPATDIPSQYAISGVNDLNDEIVSFVWVRADKNCTIRMRNIRTLVTYDLASQNYLLSTDPADRVEGEWGVLNVLIGDDDSETWKLLRARMLAILDDGNNPRYAFGFELEITFESTVGVVYMSRPTITALFDVVENSFLLGSTTLIPEVFLSQDFIDPTTNSVQIPLIRLLDVATITAGDIQDRIYSYEYKNTSNGFDATILETNSFLIEADLIDRLDHLQWLAQFRGRELLVTYEPSTEGEEWQDFLLDASTLDGSGVLAVSAIPIGGISGGVEAFFRWQVKTGYYGHNAGTVTAMISAIKLLLSGTKIVTYTVGANEITFYTKIGETLNSDVLSLSIGDENPLVLAILEPTRPLGLIINHELVA